MRDGAVSTAISKDVRAGGSAAAEGVPYEPIAWVDGRLRLLDQTLLPGELRYIELDDAAQVAEAIASMRVRGAPAIGIAAAYGLALAAGPRPRASREALRGSVEDALERLAATRPTAVNLRWALERTRAAIEVATGADEARAAALAEARAIHEEQRASDARMAEAGAALLGPLGPDAGLLTVCNTGPLATGGGGTALGVIAAAWRQGRVREVLACETRPRLQGARLTSWELRQQGIPHRLVVEGATASQMAAGRVDAVLAGADRIAANGDTANKIGTYTLAVLARHHEIPFYVVAPTSTIDLATAEGAAIPIEQRDEREVLFVGEQRIAPEGVTALNPAFDVTPAELITAIVTERGVLRPPFGPAIASQLAGAAGAAGTRA